MSRADDVRMRLAGAMRNGSRLEAVGRSVHRRLTEWANREFTERLHAALEDEIRHERIQRELADRLYQGPLPVSEGVRRAGVAGMVNDPFWTAVALNLLERSFAVRLRAIARRARQLGYGFMYDPLLETAQDEDRHVRLVTDILRAQPRGNLRRIPDVAVWLTRNEADDVSAFFPPDHLIPRSAHKLIQELT